MNILLYSSGVDSYIGYYMLQKQDLDVIPVYINLGHKYNKIEQSYVRRFRPETIIINLTDFGLYEKYDAFIPFRNLLFCLLISTYFYDSDDEFNIYLGGLKDDRVVDNSPEAFKYFSELLTKTSDKKINIKSVFDFKLTKYEIVKWYTENFNGADLLSSTFSCYSPNDKKQNPHCYSCRACFRRNVSLNQIHTLPFDRRLASDYFSEIQKNKDKYDTIRYQESIKYCKKILGLGE